MTGSAIVFEHVRKVFMGDQDVLAIDDLSFSIATGEYVCVLGRSGCGKSTAVNILLGLMPVTSGTVEVLGIDPIASFDALRHRIGCVFQTDRLMPWRSARDNVRLPLEMLRIGRGSANAEAARWLDRLGLKGFEHTLPRDLSGGMRQRVALARALASGPEIIVADETFSSLDEVTGDRLLRDFHAIAKEGRRTILHITHSIEEALKVSDRILVMGKPGRCLADIRNVAGADNQARERVRAQIMWALQVGEPAADRLHSAA